MDVEDAVSDEAIYPDFASKETYPTDCCCCGCTHIGSMIVVCEAPQQAGQPRNLWCVVGPYWTMMLFCTTPLILVPCAAAVFFISTRVHPAITVAFAAATLFVLCSLWKTATSDPGLVVRRTRDPGEGQKVCLPEVAALSGKCLFFDMPEEEEALTMIKGSYLQY